MSTEHPERKEWMIKHSSTRCHSSWRQERERKEKWAAGIDWIHNDSIFGCQRKLFSVYLPNPWKSMLGKQQKDQFPTQTNQPWMSVPFWRLKYKDLRGVLNLDEILFSNNSESVCSCPSLNTDGTNSLWIAINHRWQISLSFTWSSSYIISSCVWKRIGEKQTTIYCSPGLSWSFVDFRPLTFKIAIYWRKHIEKKMLINET